MHVCEAADEDSGLEPEWAGVAGRVKVLLTESTLLLKSELQLEVRAAKSAMAEDVSSLQARIDKQQDDAASLRSDVAAIKVLLQQLVDSNAAQ